MGTNIFAQPHLQPPNRPASTWFFIYIFFFLLSCLSVFCWIVVLHLLLIFYHSSHVNASRYVVLISFNSFLVNAFAFHCETCYMSFHFSIVLCAKEHCKKSMHISIGIRTLIMWFRWWKKDDLLSTTAIVASRSMPSHAIQRKRWHYSYFRVSEASLHSQNSTRLLHIDWLPMQNSYARNKVWFFTMNSYELVTINITCRCSWQKKSSS